MSNKKLKHPPKPQRLKIEKSVIPEIMNKKSKSNGKLEGFKEYLINSSKSKATAYNYVSYLNKIEELGIEYKKNIESEDGIETIENDLKKELENEARNLISALRAYRKYTLFLAASENKFSGLDSLWKHYIVASKEIVEKLGRTNNVVGEYAERLAAIYFTSDEIENPSSKSFDLESRKFGRVQVKARKIGPKQKSTSLGIIRSWDFDNLLTILFEMEGEIKEVFRTEKKNVQKLNSTKNKNKHQKGWVVVTNDDFRNPQYSMDITKDFKRKIESYFKKTR